jgi:hypothetical protein
VIDIHDEVPPMLKSRILTLAVAVALAEHGAPSPAATGPNLLSFTSGTIVRSYSKAIAHVEQIAEGASNDNDNAPSLADGTTGPLQITYELPGVATLSSLTVTLDPAADVAVAASTASATTGFQDVGQTKSSGAIAGASGVKARWVRVTTAAVDGKLSIKKIVATGTLAPRPANAPHPTGDFWAVDDQLNNAGGVRKKAEGEQPEHLEVVQIGDSLNGVRCSEATLETAYPGKFDGRSWTFRHLASGSLENFHGTFVINDEGSLIAGVDVGSDGRTVMRAFIRAVPSTPSLPQYCGGRKMGSVGTSVLVLDHPNCAPYDPDETDDSAAAFNR